MNNKQLNSRQLKDKKGQSLIELTLILTLLLTLMTGMVEFGNLLNQYITVVDAAREGARFGSNDDPFDRKQPKPYPINYDFFYKMDEIVEGSFIRVNNIPVSRAPGAKGALSPLKLRPEMGDDVVISFFSINNGIITRFPQNRPNGWSFYHDGTAAVGMTVYGGHQSLYSDSDLEGRLQQGSLSAPNTGMVVVEVFYNYSQILGFWTFIGIPELIPVHTYAIMPLSAAEPTPVPSSP